MSTAPDRFQTKWSEALAIGDGVTTHFTLPSWIPEHASLQVSLATLAVRSTLQSSPYYNGEDPDDLVATTSEWIGDFTFADSDTIVVIPAPASNQRIYIHAWFWPGQWRPLP